MTPRTWRQKFAAAFRGVWIGLRGEKSFAIHLPCGALVITTAFFFQAARWQWTVLVLCIATVLATELFNSALEQMAKAITSQHSPHLRDALDFASGAVLIVAFGAAVVGGIVFCDLFGWL